MFCTKCGKEINNGVKFCSSCVAETMSAPFENNPAGIPIEKKSKAIIKCGNCEYTGSGESARRKIFTIMAWFCVWFAPMITIIYYLATYKFRCPKCHSTFLRVKNKEGVFVDQKGGTGRLILIFVVVISGIAIIVILASVVLVSLNSAREKAEQTINTTPNVDENSNKKNDQTVKYTDNKSIVYFYNENDKESTVFSGLINYGEENNVEIKYKNYESGVFVESIAGIKNGDDGKYWQYYVNNILGEAASDKKVLKEMDNIEWRFEKVPFEN